MRVSPELLALLEPPQACPAGVTFVTVLANETYAPGALCLRHSLRLVGSKCPITLVLDDLDDRVPFSASTMSVLRSSFGPSYLLSLSDMYARVVSHNASAQYPSQAERPPPLLSAGVAQQSPVRRKGAARLSTEARARLREELKTELKAELRAELAQELRGGAGRRLRATFSGASHLSRLPRAGTWARGTHKKLLLWAMPGVSRAVFLDLDMLVVKNIDALAALPAFSAVAALPYSLRFFNSGVFVFEPSLAVASALWRLASRATFSKRKATATGPTVRIQAALEKFHLTDQSVLNHHFKGRWRQLPYGYNAGVKIMSADRRLWDKLDIAVIHFVASPKPWDTEVVDDERTGLHVRRAGLLPLHRRWRRQCNCTLATTRWRRNMGQCATSV